MARNTEFRNAGSKFGSTLRQSLDFISGRSGNMYTLVFLDPSRQHKRGDSRNIVIPYVVMGRDASCNIQYGEEYPTVSRQHASIQSDERGCILIPNPKATNPTYVDGKPISGYHTLTSGDEIQLSQNGPRIRFIIDNVMTAGTMGFTRRMSLAIGQSLRPYRRGIMILSLLLVSLGAYSVWNTFKVRHLKATQKEMENQLTSTNLEINRLVDSLNKLGPQTEVNQSEIEGLKTRLEGLSDKRTSLLTSSSRPEKSEATGRDGDLVKLLEKAKDDIYFIYPIDFTVGGEWDLFDEAKQYMFKWSGTGFMAKDGRFYTARHVLEPWMYPREKCTIDFLINNYVKNGGTVFLKYKAVSPTGQSFTFTHKDIHTDQSFDEVTGPYECDEFEEGVYIRAPIDSRTDWAYVTMGNVSSHLRYDRTLSANLVIRRQLYIYGFPGGGRLQSENNTQLIPVYSEALVAQNGIINGELHVSQMSFTGGNSGGPVFGLENGELVVVGLVAAGFEKIGIVVPAANFR